MCLSRETLQFPRKTKSPRSTWRRLLRQPTKPRLSRKVVPGARVNLNNYWSQFEDLYTNHLPITTFNIATTSNTGDNEINDNILNECTERSN